MPELPWYRTDCDWYDHDKILSLLSDPSPKRWQAVVSWHAAMGWSVSKGTDGRIPRVALSRIHGTDTTARLLVKYQLWEEREGAWQIRNFDHRQQLASTSERIATRARKGACIRHHGKGCGCWKEGSDDA